MKFRKKPIEVEAEQWWPGKQIEGVETATPGGACIMTLEGPHLVSPGDWIITGIKGEKYPCKADIFEATYEPVWERSNFALAQANLSSLMAGRLGHEGK